MIGFDTGYRDAFGNPYKVGSEVSYTDSQGFTCYTTIEFKNNCRIGIETWHQGFIFVDELVDDTYTVER